MKNVHGSSLVYEGKGILILGKSGSGKSSLCLKLIKSEGAILISDDRTEMRVAGERIFMHSPSEIAGLLEVRGLGVVKVDFIREHRLNLVIELVDNIDDVVRMPKEEYYIFDNIKVRKFKFHITDVTLLEKINLLIENAYVI